MLSASQSRGEHSFAQKPPKSATLVVAAIARRLGATGLGAGQIATPTDAGCIRVGQAVLAAGQTKYTDTEGLLVVRGGIAFSYNNEFGTQYGPENIGLRAGGKGVLSNLGATLLTANSAPSNSSYGGNNRIITASNQWVSHRHIFANSAQLYSIHGDSAANGYDLPTSNLRAGIEKFDPKLFIKTTPGNPHGATDTVDKLKADGAVLMDYPGMVTATEIMYRHIIFGGKEYHHHLNVTPELADRIVLVDCTAKQGASNMPGVRLGIMAGPTDIMEVANNINGHTGGNAPQIGQWMALAAFLGEEMALKALQFQIEGNPEKFLEFLEEEKGKATDAWRATSELNQSLTPAIEACVDMAAERLTEAGLAVPKPGGAFYLYADIAAGEKNVIGMKVPDNLPLYNGADPAVLEEINAEFGTDYQPMGGQIIRDSGDYSKYQLIHHGVGVVNGAAFFKPESGQVSTTFRVSAAVSMDEMGPPIGRLAHGHEILEPASVVV